MTRFLAACDPSVIGSACPHPHGLSSLTFWGWLMAAGTVAVIGVLERALGGRQS